MLLSVTRWWRLLAGALLVGGATWLAIDVAMQGQAARDDASTYGAFAVALLVPLISAVRAVAARVVVAPEPPELDQLVDDLADAVLALWRQTAQDRELLPHPLPIRWRRSTQPVAGRVTDAIRPGPVSLEPLPGIDRVTSRRVQQGTHRMLHAIYGGLPSGRLILLGEPGAGKSAAAILLMGDALCFRAECNDAVNRARIPVPVLLTLHGWDPDTTPVRDWITSTLVSQVPLLAQRRHRGQVATLLATGRIAVFLDGLDEIPERVRARALDALSAQATFRLVLLTRTAELISAAQHHTLTGALALEIQPLTSADAEDYLRQPLTDPLPLAWQRFFVHIAKHPDSQLARALTTPLTITLLRAIYPPVRGPSSPLGEIDELLDGKRFSHPDDIVHHLLDHAITAIYTPRPGQLAGSYTSETAHRALIFLARRLREAGSRNLEWWTIPGWIPRRRRLLLDLATAATIAVTVGVLYTIELWKVPGSVNGQSHITAGLLTGLAAGVFVVAFDWRANRPPKALVVKRTAWRRALAVPKLGAALAIGLTLGLGIAVIMGLWIGLVFGAAAGLASGLSIGLTLGLAFGLGARLYRGLVGDSTEVLGPRQLQRSGLVVGLSIALAAGLSLGLAIGLATGLVVGFASGLAAGLVCWLLCVVGGGLVAGFSGSGAGRMWVHQIYLCVRHGMPLRLMRFLEDARAHHLLRTVGTVYQFRHATLQDRLAPPLAAEGGCQESGSIRR